MTQIRINVPLTVRHTVLTQLGPDMRSRIEAEFNGVSVIIGGMRDVVNAMFSTGTPADSHSLIQRALSALGYVVGDHQKDVEQFSRWVDHLVLYPRSEEALMLWTEVMLARLSGSEPPMTNEAVDEASSAALRVVAQRMRLFPPAPKTGLDDGPEFTYVIALKDHNEIVQRDTLSAQMTERVQWQEAIDCASPAHARETLNMIRGQIDEWRTAAKQRGWDSPLAMRGHSALDGAELVAWRKAAKANGIASPKELAESANINFGQFVDRKVSREWQSATDCLTPAQAKSKIDSLSEQVEQRERAWCGATNRTCPGDAEQRIDDLMAQVKRQAETIRQHERDVAEWRKATGASDPDGAIARARVDLDAWQEATGAMNPHAAYKRIHDLEKQVLSYAGEIDALRKAAHSSPGPVVVNIEHGAHATRHGQTIGTVYDPERELAKVRAELDSKRRECQTAIERANELDRELSKRGVILDRIGQALGAEFSHDSLPEHVANLRKAERENDATIDKLRTILHAREGETVIDAAKRAIVPIPKPDKVEAGQKWAMVGEVRYAGSGGVYFTNGLMGAIHGTTNEGAVLKEPGAIYLGKVEQGT